MTGTWVDLRCLSDDHHSLRHVMLTYLRDQGKRSQMREVPIGPSSYLVGTSRISDEKHEPRLLGLGFKTYCGRRSKVSYVEGRMTNRDHRCWSLNECPDCKLEDRRAWVAYLLGVIDGEPHSLVATDNYDSMVERITRSKLRYVAIDQGTFWMIVSNGPVSVGYGKNRKIVSEPIENLWKCQWPGCSPRWWP